MFSQDSYQTPGRKNERIQCAWKCRSSRVDFTTDDEVQIMEAPPLAWTWKQVGLCLEFFEIFIKHLLKSPSLILVIMRIKYSQGSPWKEAWWYRLCLTSFLHRSLAGIAATLTTFGIDTDRQSSAHWCNQRKGAGDTGHTGIFKFLAKMFSYRRNVWRGISMICSAEMTACVCAKTICR